MPGAHVAELETEGDGHGDGDGDSHVEDEGRLRIEPAASQLTVPPPSSPVTDHPNKAGNGTGLPAS